MERLPPLSELRAAHRVSSRRESFKKDTVNKSVEIAHCYGFSSSVSPTRHAHRDSSRRARPAAPPKREPLWGPIPEGLASRRLRFQRAHKQGGPHRPRPHKAGAKLQVVLKLLEFRVFHHAQTELLIARGRTRRGASPRRETAAAERLGFLSLCLALSLSLSLSLPPSLAPSLSRSVSLSLSLPP